MLAEVRVGDPADFRNFMGAGDRPEGVREDRGYIAGAKRAPRAVLFGGGVDDRDGYFIAPTLIM